MKKKELMIISLIVIVLLALIIWGVNKNKGKEEETPQPQIPAVGVVEENKVEEFVEVKTDGTKVNTSAQLSKTKKVDGLEISNIKLKENGNVSQLTADVKNPTTGTLGGFAVTITVLDKTGKEIAVIGGYIDKVEAGKTVKLNASATVDIANAYDFKVSK